MQEIFNYLIQNISDIGYFGVFILMLLNSFFIPLLGKLVLVPSGYLVFTEHMDLSLLLISSILGNTVGSLLNYFIAHKFFNNSISKDKISKIQKYFIPHARPLLFTSVFIPATKQIIVFLSGLYRIKIKSFLFYTILASTIYNCLLVSLGYFVGNNEELVSLYFQRMVYVSIIFAIMFTISYYLKELSRKYILLKIIRIFIIFIILPIIIFAIILAIYLFMYGNFHKVSNEVYRSSQIRSYNMLHNHIKNNNIKTILNLRGKQEDTTWYIKENKFAKDNNLILINYRLAASFVYSVNKMDDIINTIEKAKKPLLIHCKSGADRTSLVSALYIYSLKKDKKEASKQISIIYGHFPWLGSETIGMDKSFQRYINEK